MSKDTGGPAFPITPDMARSHPGMTLRDYLAAQALKGPVNSFHYGAPPAAGVPVADWARRAYEIADAMLAERAKGGEA